MGLTRYSYKYLYFIVLSNTSENSIWENVAAYFGVKLYFDVIPVLS